MNISLDTYLKMRLSIFDFLNTYITELYLSSQVAAIFEHIAGIRMQGPIRPFARLIRRSRHFDEAVVETQRVPDRILPTLLILPVKREQVHDELIDVAQSQHFRGRILNGHRDQRNIRIRRFRVRVRAPIRFLPGVLQRRHRRRRAGQPTGHGGHGGRRHGSRISAMHRRRRPAHGRTQPAMTSQSAVIRMRHRRG